MSHKVQGNPPAGRLLSLPLLLLVVAPGNLGRSRAPRTLPLPDLLPPSPGRNKCGPRTVLKSPLSGAMSHKVQGNPPAVRLLSLPLLSLALFRCGHLPFHRTVMNQLTELLLDGYEPQLATYGSIG